MIEKREPYLYLTKKETQLEIDEWKKRGCLCPRCKLETKQNIINSSIGNGYDIVSSDYVCKKCGFVVSIEERV